MPKHRKFKFYSFWNFFPEYFQPPSGWLNPLGCRTRRCRGLTAIFFPFTPSRSSSSLPTILLILLVTISTIHVLQVVNIPKFLPKCLPPPVFLNTNSLLASSPPFSTARLQAALGRPGRAVLHLRDHVTSPEWCPPCTGNPCRQSGNPGATNASRFCSQGYLVSRRFCPLPHPLSSLQIILH